MYVGSNESAGALAGIPHLYMLETGATDFTELTLPLDVTATTARPCFLAYRRRLYILGMYSPNIVIDEHKRVWRMGIHAPTAAPTVAASGTGLTNNYVLYLTFVQKDSEGKTIHESNLSAATSLSLTNQGRAWTSLPTSSIDVRVTHKRGYASVNGSVPHLVWERELSITSVTESISDSIVLNNTEAPVDSNDDLTHGRGVPQYARIGVIWRDRAWTVGDPGHVVNYSELFEPESAAVDPDERSKYTSTLPTKGGETIIGLQGFEDALVLYCVGAEYAITGYGETSFEMRRISRSTSCLSHHAIADARGTHIYPVADGIGLRVTPAEGAFRNLLENTYRDQWADEYEASPLPFEDSQAVFDEREGNYILLTNRTADTEDETETLAYVLPVDDTLKGETPNPALSHDIQTRKITSVGRYSPAGAKQGRVLYGSDEGFVYKEDPEDTDDDGDDYGKAITIRHKHMFFGDQVGDSNHGRQYHAIDIFAKSDQDMTLRAYTGDDDAASGMPQLEKVIPTASQSGATDKTSYRKTTELSGKGITVEIGVASPVGFEYRGMAVTHSVGSQTRNPTS